MRALLSTLLFLSWLWAAALAASPALHEWAHHDAGQADHECLAKLIALGVSGEASVEMAMDLGPGWMVSEVCEPAMAWVVSLTQMGAAWPLGPPRAGAV